MKRIKHLTVLIICFLITTACIVPISAKSNITKDESVYVLLESNGNQNEVIVSEWLHSDNGFDNYIDTTILNNLKSLNSDEEIRVNNNQITFNTKENDIYYQGESDKELPFKLNIRYYLDDEEYDADELLNKSGHLKIEIKIINNLGTNQLLPLVMMTNLNKEEFSNIKVDSGEIITDGMNQMVMMMTVVGLNEITNDIDLIDFNEYLKDSFVIECDAKEMSVPSIMGASAIKDNLSLDDFNIDTTEMDNDLNKLKNATNEIKDGTAKLKDANETLASKMNEFNDQIISFNSATKSLMDNTAKLKDGMNSLNDGIKTLTNTFNLLASSFDSLSKEDKEQIIKTIKELETIMINSKKTLSIMKNNLQTTSEKLTNIDQMIINSISFDELKNIYAIFADSLLGNISQEVKNGILNANVDTSVFINNDNLQIVVANLVNSGMSQEEAMALALSMINPQAINGVKENMANQISQAITSDSIKETIKDDGAKTSKTIIEKVANGAKKSMSQEMIVMLEMINGANELIDNIGAKMGVLDTVLTKVDFKNIENVLNVLENKDSLDTLVNGSNTINNGMASLYDGTVKINEASNKILEATNSFNDATKTLKDKTKELDDGVNKFSKEGIDTLDNKLHDLLDKFKTIENKLELITDNQNIYSNFGGVSNDTNASVKFIFKTKELDKPINKVVENQEKTNEKLSFFDRIINLFK